MRVAQIKPQPTQLLAAALIHPGLSADICRLALEMRAEPSPWGRLSHLSVILTGAGMPAVLKGWKTWAENGFI